MQKILTGNGKDVFIRYKTKKIIVKYYFKKISDSW
jgi:hypothetical protein